MEHFEGLQISRATLHKLVLTILKSIIILASNTSYWDIVTRESANMFQKEWEINF